MKKKTADTPTSKHYDVFVDVLERWWNVNGITDTTGDRLYKVLVRQGLLKSFRDELVAQIAAPSLTVEEFNRLTHFGLSTQVEMLAELEELLLGLDPDRDPE